MDHVHDTFRADNKRLESAVNHLRIELATMQAAQCDDIKHHMREHHNPVRTWGIVVGVVAVFTFVLELVKSFWIKKS